MDDSHEIEDVLGRIETGIRQLKTQYDMYFSGALKRPPYEVRKELETLIDTVGTFKMKRFADRFRYNSLATKYQTMCELWSKMMRAKEEGRLRPGIPGFVEPVGALAARAAVRRKALSERMKTSPPPTTDRRRSAPVKDVFYTASFSGATRDEAPLKELYEKFLEANRNNGLEASGRVSYNRFAKQIAQKTETIKKKSGCESVTYSIVFKDKGVTLKAIPRRGQGEKK